MRVWGGVIDVGFRDHNHYSVAVQSQIESHNNPSEMNAIRTYRNEY